MLKWVFIPWLRSGRGARRSGSRDLAGWRALGHGLGVAPVSSPLARHSRGEALRWCQTLSSGLPEVDTAVGCPQLFITSVEHSASVCVQA